MQLVVYFKDCPVRSPTMPILGTSGGPYHFSWDQARAVHCRRYNLDDPADIARLRDEQARLYNQKMPHPIFFDVEGESVSSEAVGVMALDLQKALADVEEKEKQIVELRRRVRPRKRRVKAPLGKPLIEVLVPEKVT